MASGREECLGTWVGGGNILSLLKLQFGVEEEKCRLVQGKAGDDWEEGESTNRVGKPWSKGVAMDSLLPLLSEQPHRRRLGPDPQMPWRHGIAVWRRRCRRGEACAGLWRGFGLSRELAGDTWFGGL